ncbi:hypothetical protein Tco_1225496, partial [Tanacetum coccineum]
VPKFLTNPNAAKRSKTYGSSSFNTESGDAIFNLNVDAGDDDEDDVQVLPRPIGRDMTKGMKKKVAGSSGSLTSMNDEALARREVECREREIEMQEYRQRQKDLRFYMQPYDHLTRDALTHMEALRAEIKAKWNLPF